MYATTCGSQPGSPSCASHHFDSFQMPHWRKLRQRPHSRGALGNGLGQPRPNPMAAGEGMRSWLGATTMSGTSNRNIIISVVGFARAARSEWRVAAEQLRARVVCCCCCCCSSSMWPPTGLQGLCFLVCLVLYGHAGYLGSISYNLPAYGHIVDSW